MYIYKSLYIYVFVNIYVYISLYIYIYIYIYISLYIYMYIYYEVRVDFNYHHELRSASNFWCQRYIMLALKCNIVLFASQI